MAGTKLHTLLLSCLPCPALMPVTASSLSPGDLIVHLQSDSDDSSAMFTLCTVQSCSIDYCQAVELDLRANDKPAMQLPWDEVYSPVAAPADRRHGLYSLCLIGNAPTTVYYAVTYLEGSNPPKWRFSDQTKRATNPFYDIGGKKCPSLIAPERVINDLSSSDSVSNDSATLTVSASDRPGVFSIKGILTGNKRKAARSPEQPNKRLNLTEEIPPPAIQPIQTPAASSASASIPPPATAASPPQHPKFYVPMPKFTSSASNLALHRGRAATHSEVRREDQSTPGSGYVSALGNWHAWNTGRQIPNSELRVAPYIAHFM
jgi:hypothetical protein